MAENEIGLRLDGIVTLELFNQAMSNFTAMVTHLSEEVAGNNAVEWTVTDLQVGSAYISVRGNAQNEIDVRRVVAASRVVTESLSAGVVIPYSEYVELAAINISSLINGKIKAVRFFSGESDPVIINSAIVVEHANSIVKRDYGTIVGDVSSITERPDVKFSLYDEIGDRRTVCYLSRDKAELARNSWLKKVAVTGWIRRDPNTGRAIDIKDITEIEVITPVEGAFLNARGMFGTSETTERSENIIRRLRNGE